MINRKKLQQIFFFLIFINCCIILCITSISISTDYWVVARPFRKIDSKIAEYQTVDEDYSSISREIEQENALLPIDLNAKSDCKRYNGKIRFGLFKGIWVLNYAYGCKNRVNRVSMFEMLSKHKLFDQTLWLSTILCCSLALIATFISSIFCLFNVFLTPERPNGPISLYLWNTISALFHLLALVLFAVEFHVYIIKNVMTKEELDNGWVSLNRAQLFWSYYLLIISLVLITLNIVIIYVITTFKKSFTSFKTQYEINAMNNAIQSEQGNILVDSEGVVKRTEYQQIDNEFKRTTDLRSSQKLKRIIDFVY